MRKKQRRFQDNAASKNVIEAGKGIFENIKGNWNDFFGNQNSITVELACGRGEYTIGLARIFPDSNFVGVDIKGARIWKGSSIANQENLFNVAFLRTQIDHLEKFFDHDEVNHIWITFPDPQPRESDQRKRLTNNRFLDMYKNILKKGGDIHFKTDNEGLFAYTLEILEARNDIEGLVFTKDLYASNLLEEHFGIQTRYEQKFLDLGCKINYMRFRFVNRIYG